MNRMINEDFYKYCSKDIDEILEEVEVFMPVIEDWQLNKGYYKDEEKRLIFRYLYDDNMIKIGQSIDIFDMTNNARYTLIYNDIGFYGLSWEEDYFKDGEHISEKVDITYDGASIGRFFSVNRDNVTIIDNTAYDLTDKNDYRCYLNKPSIRETIVGMREMTPETMVRKRK